MTPSVSIETVISKAPPTLKLTDRCDACRAQAYVAVESEAGELHFCAHHANKYYDALTEQGWEITVDARDELG